MKKSILALCATCLLVSAGSERALAAGYTFNAKYFKVTRGGDFGQYINGAFLNEVLPNLGPNGLPVYNSGYGSFPLVDINPGTQELLWWTPDGSHVFADGAGVISSPYANFSLYPSGGTGSSDASGFQTAIFSGNLGLSTAQTVTFTFGGDDDALLFVDGVSVGQLGGVHAHTTASPTTSLLSAGNHVFSLFYADRHETGASLQFSIDTAGITVTPAVPEPTTWAMMLFGFGVIGFAIRKRSNISNTISYA